MREHVLTVLQGIVGPDNLLTEKPLPVVLPASADEIAKIMRLANEEKIQILSQQPDVQQVEALSSTDAIILSLARMNTIVDMDTANLVATVDPGVTIAQLNQALADFGLFYPLDPGRGETTTLGEIVAQNFTGLRGLKYGATKHYIMGLQVVLPDGRLLRTGGKNVKDVAGYDLTKLMTGSNNTLGIITGVTVKLMPAPAQQQLLIASFGSTADAGKAIAAIFAAKVVPSAAELLDGATVRALAGAGHSSLPAAEAVVMLELDGIPQAVAKAASTIATILQSYQVQQVLQAENAQAASGYWASRQAASAVLAAHSAVSLDITVPRSRLSEALERIKATAEKHGVTVAVFGHAGEGNLFPSIMMNANSDPAKTAPVQEELLQALRGLGSSINGTAHHLEMQYGRAGLDAMQHVKQALDPNCILNPGKLVGAC